MKRNCITGSGTFESQARTQTAGPPAVSSEGGSLWMERVLTKIQTPHLQIVTPSEAAHMDTSNV